MKKTCCQKEERKKERKKEERKKEETSKKQDPAGVTGRVKKERRNEWETRPCRSHRQGKEETSEKQDPAGVTGRVTRHCCRHRRRTLPAGRQRPPWPQFDPLSCKCYRGSEANACIWVTWIHYVTRRRESILSENQDLTPNDPRLTFDPINADDVT